MKKNILLILMFVTMFFIGNNDVFAAKICEIKDNENTTNECEQKVKTFINSWGGELACLYEVELKDGNKTEKYYNYIYTTNKGLYGGTSLGSEKNNLTLARNEAAWLMGEAYNSLYQNNQCPLNSYIDTKRFNEVCFDNGGNNDCLNNNNEIDKKTNFNNTIKSTLIEKNTDAIKFKNLNYSSSCYESNLPQGYDKVCRYRNGGDIVLLLPGNSTNTIIFTKPSLNIRTVIKAGEKKTAYYNPKDQKADSVNAYANTYTNSVNLKGNSCPSEIYLNEYELSVDGTGENIKNYKIETTRNSNNTIVLELTECGLNEEELPEYQGCEIINDELRDDINTIMGIIRIAVPILLIGLVTYDFATAVFAGDDKAVSKARGNAIKRVIIAIIIFFVPTFVNFIFNIVNDVWGKNYEICGIEEENQ